MRFTNHRRSYYIIARELGKTYNQISKETSISVKNIKKIIRGDISPNILKNVPPRIFKYDKSSVVRKETIADIHGKVRIRDEDTCQVCKKVWVSGKKFDVHHKEVEMGRLLSVEYDKNNMDKLITFCHPCHQKVHSEIKKTNLSTDEILKYLIISSN